MAVQIADVPSRRQFGAVVQLEVGSIVIGCTKSPCPAASLKARLALLAWTRENDVGMSAMRVWVPIFAWLAIVSKARRQTPEVQESEDFQMLPGAPRFPAWSFQSPRERGSESPIPPCPKMVSRKRHGALSGASRAVLEALGISPRASPKRNR